MIAVVVNMIKFHRRVTAGIAGDNHSVAGRVIIAVQRDVHHQRSAVAAVVSVYLQRFKFGAGIFKEVNGAAVELQMGQRGAAGHIPYAVGAVERQIDRAAVQRRGGAVEISVICRAQINRSIICRYRPPCADLPIV